jgi:signal transduction histidine kinase
MSSAPSPEPEAVEVFIVDDTPSNLSLLSGILRDAGHSVRMASSGRRALAMADALAPELIMLDITMPEMDGYELCRALKARPATALVPVIFISALAEPLDKVRAFHTGGVDYVTKPFDAGEVLARVETQLRLERLRREREAQNRELARLNLLKNDFIGIAAHDLRSPLVAVLGYSELMLRDDLKPSYRVMLSEIQHCGQFMLRLINDLLDVAVIESGRVRLALAPVELGALLRRAVDLEARLAAPKRIGVELEPVPGEVGAEADADKLQQVMNNLIGNAVKFSQPGTTVRVALRVDGEVARITVTDQGPGIPAGEVERIFEPFQMTSVQSTAGEKSTGLGLAIVRKIVTAHGGRVRADSQVGRGTTIEFTLPLEAARPPADGS